MSNEMFTQLPTVTNAMLGDIICAVQGNTSVQETLGQVINLANANVVLNFPGNPNGNLAGNTFQLCWDTTNKVLYVCTTTGSTVTAVWTLVVSNSTILNWNNVTTPTQTMLPANGYVAASGSLVTFTLPMIAAFGTQISLIGFGSGGWTIAQNAGQNIQVGNLTSTTGIGGSVSSSLPSDSIDLICIVANTTWSPQGGPQGNLTIV
jgi:hypothetical protein